MGSMPIRSVQDDARRVKDLMEKKPALRLENAAAAFVAGVGITGKKNQKSWAKKIIREMTKPATPPRSVLRTKSTQSRRLLTLEQINLAREGHEDQVPVDDSDEGTRNLRLL